MLKVSASKRYAFCGNETGGLGLPFFIGLCCSYAALASRFFCPPGGAYFRFDWQKRLRVRSCFWLGIPACSEKTVCATAVPCSRQATAFTPSWRSMAHPSLQGRIHGESLNCTPE